MEPKAKAREDAVWAKQAVDDMLAGCVLNARVVNAGFWHKLIADMDSYAELEAYATLVTGCKEVHELALKVEAFGQKKLPDKRA